MSTVIIGAGIIGTSTAYYLSQPPSQTAPTSIHLVESSPRFFASASGYASGFLARDWYGPSVSSLGALSFDLHKQLAAEHGGREKWGWSRSTGTSMTHSGDAGNGKRGDDWLREGSSRAQVAGEHAFVEGNGPAWLTKQRGGKVEVISRGDSTAQVDPLRLSQFLLEQCRTRGVQIHQPAKVISASQDLHGDLSSVRILSSTTGTETDIPCTRLIITAGAWTPLVFTSLFPTATLTIPVTSLAGHSLVLKSPRYIPSSSDSDQEQEGTHAVFTTDSLGFSPEIFSRSTTGGGGEIYIAGLNSSSIPLPALATETRIDDEAIEQLMAVSAKLLGLPGQEVSDLEVVRKGLCFRPVTPSGRPIVGRVPDEKLGGGMRTRGGGIGGVFVSAGHGPWGISLSLGTGRVLSEMVEGRETSARVEGLGF
ncbi:hypothetical protein MMC16_002223 [Acarospora aff. strigata]|nr:hypothetical protein [Acarospora aff. strigata]